MNNIDTQEDEMNATGKKGEASRESFKQASRRRLFQIFFEIMQERNTDFIFAVIMIAANFVQICGLLYNDKVNFPFRDDIYQTIYGLCDIIRIYPLLAG